jgi:hypothetical protein
MASGAVQPGDRERVLKDEDPDRGRLREQGRFSRAEREAQHGPAPPSLDRAARRVETLHADPAGRGEDGEAEASLQEGCENARPYRVRPVDSGEVERDRESASAALGSQRRSGDHQPDVGRGQASGSRGLEGTGEGPAFRYRPCGHPDARILSARFDIPAPDLAHSSAGDDEAIVR